MKGALFVVDFPKDIVDMVMHCGHAVEPFFCGGRGEFVVILEVNCARVEAIETSVGGEFVGSGRCGVVGKFSKWEPCSPPVLPVMAVDAEVLLQCLDGSFTESVSLGVVGS